MDQVIGDIAVGAMEPAHMLQRIGPRTLVIVPGDREDVILALTTTHLMGPPRAGGSEIALEATLGGIGSDALPAGRPDAAGVGHAGAALGLVLTGGYRPRPAVLDAIRGADLFAVLVPEDTYAIASEVHDLLVKTHVADAEKIEAIKALVWDHLEIDRVLDAARPAAV
jgi:BioD-like phosphotransacetylase family protein